MLASFLVDVHARFKSGTGRLLQNLWLQGYFPQLPAGPPSEQAYNRACAKLPVALMAKAVSQSCRQARSDNRRLYEGMQVVLVDGTKIIIPRTKKTVRKYHLGKGSVGKAYYPQINASAFLDLATGTFTSVNLDHGKSSERKKLLKHARECSKKTLFIGDAGYNGMGFVCLFQHTGQELLMELKMGKLVKFLLFKLVQKQCNLKKTNLF